MRGKDRRAWLSDGLILLGVAALVGAALFWVKNVLAAEQLEHRAYLLSSVDHAPPLPTAMPSPTSTPTEAPPTLTAQSTRNLELEETEPDTLATTTGDPELSGSLVEATQQPTITATMEAPTPVPPSSRRIVRLVIPRLKIDRTVITIGMVGKGKNADWNTNKLFANRNRPDLVGHLKTSVNPGDGSNIVLVGHNYNNSGYNWTGVFHNIKGLRPGDRVKVYTQNGGEHHYEVQKVKQVPWVKKRGDELEKHQGFLWPKPHEQLTLVTCGGVNLWTWSARVYVVALPVDN